MSDAPSADVEAGLVIWIGVQAVGFAVAEARSWSMGGGCGCCGCGCGGNIRVSGGGWRSFRVLWIGEAEEIYTTEWI